MSQLIFKSTVLSVIIICLLLEGKDGRIHMITGIYALVYFTMTA